MSSLSSSSSMPEPVDAAWTLFFKHVSAKFAYFLNSNPILPRPLDKDARPLIDPTIESGVVAVKLLGVSHSIALSGSKNDGNEVGSGYFNVWNLRE